jgi:hypothetical protein
MPKSNLTLPYLIEAVRLHGNSDECLLWPHWCDRDGYGRCTSPDGGHIKVHRLAFILFVGPVPGGLWVLHSCDMPPCFNPIHLWTGTCADNDKDRDLKGRASGPKGAANINSKLTVDLVRQLRIDRANGETYLALAAKYGIHQYPAWCAVTRRTWKHVP